MRNLKLLFSAMLFTVPLLAHADIPCTDVPHHNHDHTYKKGERSWLHDGGNVYHVYVCDKNECTSRDPYPGNSGSPWKLLGSHYGSCSR
jgi:hypothetical protein